MNINYDILNKYKPLKKQCIWLASLWTIGVLLLLLGLLLTIFIGIDSIKDESTGKTNTKINLIGILLLSLMCGFGAILSLSSQFIFPTFMKKKLIKINDKNYVIMMNHINKIFSNPISASFLIIKQIEWIAKYHDEELKQQKEIDDYLNSKEFKDRKQKEKEEQKKLNKIYKSSNKSKK